MTDDLYNKKCHKALVYPLPTSFRGGVGCLLIFEKKLAQVPLARAFSDFLFEGL